MARWPPTAPTSRGASSRAAPTSRSRWSGPTARPRPRRRRSTDSTTFIENAVEAWNVPGAGIAIVSGGEVVYAKGFGFRDLEAKKPMTADTLFAIGSTTKAMTATTLGMLVDEGKVEWDEPLRTICPRSR